jgi:hypothetical protein
VDELPVPLSEVIPSRFVNKWKNSKVKSRLVVQAYNEQVDDRDDIYAATPLISALKVLLLLSLSLSWSIVGFDVNTAFLHASIPESSFVFIWPPKEYASENDSVVWQLKKSLYGLRTSPKAWQDHVFNVFTEAQLIQMRSECNVWRNQQSNFFIMIYVDDILCIGQPEVIQEVMDRISQVISIKKTGELTPGSSMTFLGSQIEHHVD